VVAPPEIPVTTPVEELTVPIAAIVLLHTPPAVPLAVNVVVAPAQTVAVPLMVPGVANGFTVAILVAVTAPQPFVTVYDIVVVPAVMPLTTPVAEPTVPIAAFVLLHTPPLVPLVVNVVVAPTHTVAVPLIMPGVASGFTVAILVAATVPQALVTV
jgi:hypothetical protein